MKKIYRYSFICVFFFIMGLYIGKSQNNLKEIDIQCYLNNNIQTFRDNIGKKIKILELDGVYYLPLSKKGTFLEYSVNIDKTINLETKEISNNIDTYTLNGERFTNDNLYLYNYTMFINWANWCSDCSKFMSDLAKNYEKLEQMGIQVIGLPMNTNRTEILKACSKLPFKFQNLIITNDIEENFQSNVKNIPDIVLVDNRGIIVYKTENLEILKIFEDIANLPKCHEC